MSAYRSEKEVKQHHIEKMGNDLGSLYHALWREFGWLSMKWDEYVELYGTKPSRIELLNRASGHFFRIVQDTLWEDTLMHISRITDPPKSMSKENLTIMKLPELIGDKGVKEQVSKLIDIAVEKAEFCRDWRNRHIAHIDFDLAMKSSAKPLQSANLAKVKEVLHCISDVLNAVSEHYMDSTTVFSIKGELCGAGSLLYFLSEGLRAEEERIDRLNAGIPSDEDFQSRDI
jgi:hypothetical protein